jgi:hypothetical protein
MGYQVSLTPSARRDMRDSSVSFDSVERALAFGRKLIRHTRHLATFLKWAAPFRNFTTL